MARAEEEPSAPAVGVRQPPIANPSRVRKHPGRTERDQPDEWDDPAADWTQSDGTVSPGPEPPEPRKEA